MYRNASSRNCCCVTVFPLPKGPGIAAEPPLATGKNVSAPKDNKRDASDNFSGLPKEKMLMYALYVVTIILGLGLIFVLYWIFFPTPYDHYKLNKRRDGIKINRFSNFIAQRFGWVEEDE